MVLSPCLPAVLIQLEEEAAAAAVSTEMPPELAACPVKEESVVAADRRDALMGLCGEEDACVEDTGPMQVISLSPSPVPLQDPDLE